MNVAVILALVKNTPHQEIHYAMKVCRNLARRTSLSNLKWLSNFLIKCSELKSCPIMGLNIFHTLNRATSNRGNAI